MVTRCWRRSVSTQCFKSQWC